MAIVAGMAAANAKDNPLLSTWTAPFGAPPFDRVEPSALIPAFEEGMARHKAAINAITGNPEPAGFDNTIAALERADRDLDRVQRVFGTLTGNVSSDELEAIEREMAPILAKHSNAIFLDAALYARVKSVFDAREALGLSGEQRRLVERIHTRFVRAGAGLAPEKRARFAAINERLAELSTRFGQNVLKDERDYRLVLETQDDLAGLPDFLRASASAAAKATGLEGKHVITLSRSSVEPFLQLSARRDLRETVWRAWVMRGDNGDAEDNKAIIAETVALRIERARLLGYETHAHYMLDDRMAKTPEAALALMREVWAPARDRAREEAEALTELMRADGINDALEPWDWRYYAEKLRKARYDLDEAETKPYLQLGRLIEAQFYVAERLFGITFAPRDDIPVFHPDVRVWEVKDKAGATVGLFYGDYFARPSKRSGAWASALRRQERLDGKVIPLIMNTCNFAQGAKGEPALLSLDDAETLFHEFGHALHGLLSDVTYPSLAGTAVPTDFVEFPSQLYEHWLTTPEILSRFAIHYRTGEAMPADLIARIRKASSFNQGFATVEFLGSAFVDMDIHLLTNAADLDVRAFEKEALAEIGMPREIVMRHRSTHFQHIFSGGYSAGYYSYMWSEVLDADGFNAFKERGDPFAPAEAARLKEFIYSGGNTRDPAEAYRAFRGRDPSTKPLLEQRGFVAAE
ncbi:MAG: M3 family metallopeptidase [Alphaproteobacteria bacterium]|nr:M3 family metallopeptidase [Alphaproteobacteria bacterium]